MTNTTMGALREVQKLDERITEIRSAVTAFDDRLAEVEEPALLAEKELSQLQERLTQMKADARRLERAADDKRERGGKMEQRLTRVTNLREETAARTELDLIRRAIEIDEQEALHLIDQIRRLELAEEELQTRTSSAREEAESSQAALVAERSGFEGRMNELQARRAEVLSVVTPMERRVYDSFHQSGRMVVVAELHEDGACGHCFGVVPLQVQNEIRQSGSLVRCEACGVILTTEPPPVLDPRRDVPGHLAADSSDEGEDGEGTEEDGPEADVDDIEQG